jgi:hypothetical protein
LDEDKIKKKVYNFHTWPEEAVWTSAGLRTQAVEFKRALEQKSLPPVEEGKVNEMELDEMIGKVDPNLSRPKIYKNENLELFKTKLLSNKRPLRALEKLEEGEKYVIDGIVIRVEVLRTSLLGKAIRKEIVLDINGILCKVDVPMYSWEKESADFWISRLREAERKEKTITVYEYVK